MENKKYELVDPFMYGCIRLYSIRALRDFSDVIAGELGGYVEGYHNLSQEGNCWIYDNARVYENAEVLGDARVYDNARMFDYAKVRERAEVCDTAMIYGHADVFGHALVCDKAIVHGISMVYGHTSIKNVADIRGNAVVYGDAVIMHNSILDDAAKVHGNSKVVGCSVISDNADISSDKDYLFIKGLGSENRSTTAFKLSDGSIYIRCGCFKGTLAAFESKVNDTHGDSLYGKEYKMLIDMCKLHFGLIK